MAKKNERLENTIKLLEEGVAEVIDSQQYKNWLDCMAKFYDYSPNNCLLILRQCPEATRVASYRKWKNDFNRQVRKGERAIYILAPIPHKYTTKETDKKTGEEVTKEHCWTGFRAVPVFDISQTEGEELPTIVKQLEGTDARFDDMREHIEDVIGIPIKYVAGYYVNGSYDRATNTITIKEELSPEHTVKTLIHEWAHSLIHYEGAAHTQDERFEKELQAEGTAYLVCSQLGMDTSDYSFGYLASWSGDVKNLCKQMSVIRKTANEMLAMLSEDDTPDIVASVA